MEKITNLLSGRTKECTNNEIVEAINKTKDDYQYKDWMNQISISIIKISEASYPLVGDRKEIFICETERTNGNLEKILNEFAASSDSEIYKSILVKYISYPAYIREQIIHQKNFKELSDYENEFDYHAQSLFNSIEKDRPKRIAIKPVKIEYYNDKPQQYLIYTLRCTDFQILNYLKQFSYHVKILNNDVLKKKLMEYYEKAYK